MAVGTVSTSILTDIANAIRYQAGVATLYKPRKMAATVAELDGTDAGSYQEQPYMALESGVLPESVFSDIAAAIRGQNGESTLYAPGDMAAAILALEWDVGYKIRAVARRRDPGDQLLRAAHVGHRRLHRAGLRDRPGGLLFREREVVRLHQAAGEEGLHRLVHRGPGHH